MTALAITPNYEKKRLKLAGTVAAGEHVAVTIVGGGAWIGTGKALRLRVICGARTVAKFPFWTEDNAGDWPEDVVSADAWASANEGADATCVLNLNTVPAAKLLRFGGMCLWVLDDAENHTLYGSGEYIVEPWPKERGEDEPYNLDEYPDIVAELGERIDAAEESISGAVDEASGIVAYVTAARNDAQTAAQTAGTARSQAQQAKGAAEDAQTAAETAQGLAETAQGKAEDAQTAAEVAQAAAEAAQEAAEAALPLDTTLATEGKAADAKAVGDALDAKADATATSAALLALDSEKADKATTLAGYGIADALISNGTVILGSNSITPLTSHQDISGKADKSTTYTKTEVDAIVQALKTGSRQIVGTLPASGEPMVIYMVPKSASQTNNAYDEYIWTAVGAWEKIGDTEIDLSGYVQTTDPRLSDARTPTAHKSSHATGGSDAIAPSDIGAAASSHTHAASDITSGLATVATTGSYNDLTNKPTIPTIPTPVAPASATASGQFADALATKSELAAKQDTISDLSSIRSGAAAGATAVQPESGKGLSTEDYTTAEKQKLAGIAAGADVTPTPIAPSANPDDAGNAADAYATGMALSAKAEARSGTQGNIAVYAEFPTLLEDSGYAPSDFATSADIPSPSSTTPSMDGTAAVGVSDDYARADHVHPTDTSRVAANTAITGATKCKITYDSKGLVTAGADLDASDIPTITTAKLSDFDAAIHYTSAAQSVASDTIALSERTGNVIDLTSYDDTDTIAVTMPATPTAASGKVANVLLRVVTGATVPTLDFDETANVFIAADDAWATLEASSHNVFSFTASGTSAASGTTKSVWIVGRVTAAVETGGV